MMSLCKFVIVLLSLMVISSNAMAVNEAAEWNWKDIKIGLEGDYQMFGKYFYERDINSYDGNIKPAYNISPPPDGKVIGQATNGQTDRIEAWLENELFLVPSIEFSDKLKFQARVDIDYLIFDSDNNTKTLYEPMDQGSGYVLYDKKKADQEIRLTEAFVQMITPVGLFVAGRFNDGSNGLVWAAQFNDSLPGWTFALAWNKKEEQKYYYEDPDVPYYNPNTRNGDFLDRDDMDEVRVVTKPYFVKWLDTTTVSPVTKAEYIIYAPNLSADEFDLTDAWTLQWKIDFKFNLNPSALAAVTSTEMHQ